MFLNSTSTTYTQQSLSGHLVSSARDVATSTVVQLSPRIRGGLPPRALRRVREFIEARERVGIAVVVEPFTARHKAVGPEDKEREVMPLEGPTAGAVRAQVSIRHESLKGRYDTAQYSL